MPPSSSRDRLERRFDALILAPCGPVRALYWTTRGVVTATARGVQTWCPQTGAELDFEGRAEAPPRTTTVEAAGGELSVEPDGTEDMALVLRRPGDSAPRWHVTLPAFWTVDEELLYADVPARISVSPDGDRVAVAGWGALTICRLRDGALCHPPLDRDHLMGMSDIHLGLGERLVCYRNRAMDAWSEVRAYQRDSGALRLRRAADGVMGAALSPDGVRVLEHGRSYLRLKSVADDRVLHPAIGCELERRGVGDAVAWFSDAERVLVAVAASVVRDGFARVEARLSVLSLASGREIQCLARQDIPADYQTGLLARAVRLSSDERVALGWPFGARSLRRWCLETCQELAPVGAHDADVVGASAVAAPDGLRVISWDRSGQVIVNLCAGDRVDEQFRLPLRGVRSAALSRCGRCLAIGFADGRIILHDASTGAALEILDGHSRAVAGLRFLLDGRLLSGAEDGTCACWRVHPYARPVTVAAGLQAPFVAAHSLHPARANFVERFREIRQRLLREEHAEGVGEAHRDATRAVAAFARSADTRPRLIHGRSSQGPLTWVAVSPDGCYLAASEQAPLARLDEEGGRIHIWEVDSGRCVALLDQLSYGVAHVNGYYKSELLQWRPDSRALAFLRCTGLLEVWSPFGEAAGGGFHNPDRTVSFCWAPDGSRLAVATWEEGLSVGTCDAGDFSDMAETHWLARGQEAEQHMRWLWSTDGDLLIGHGSARYGCDVWDARDGTRLQHRRHQVIPSPDGRALFDSGERAVIRTRSGAVIWRLPADAPPVRTVAWSADSRILAIAHPRSVFVVSAEDGSPVCTISCVSSAPVRDDSDFGRTSPLAFSRDGARLAVLTGDGVSIHLLATPTAAEALLAMDGAAPKGLAFGAGDRTLVTWSERCLVFWDLPTGHPINALDLRDTPGFQPCGEIGHPLALDGIRLGRATVPDRAFATPGQGRWAWVTAFTTGLIVCPEEADDALRSGLSLVFPGERPFAWPAHWALGTELLELHRDWPAALESDRCPALPAILRRRLSAGLRPAPKRRCILEEHVAHPAYRPDQLTPERLAALEGTRVAWKARYGSEGVSTLALGAPDVLVLEERGRPREVSLDQIVWLGPAHPIPDASAMGTEPVSLLATFRRSRSKSR